MWFLNNVCPKKLEILLFHFLFYSSKSTNSISTNYTLNFCIMLSFFAAQQFFSVSSYRILQSNLPPTGRSQIECKQWKKWIFSHFFLLLYLSPYYLFVIQLRTLQQILYSSLSKALILICLLFRYCVSNLWSPSKIKPVIVFLAISCFTQKLGSATMGMVYKSRCWFYIELSIPVYVFSGLFFVCKRKLCCLHCSWWKWSCK